MGLVLRLRKLGSNTFRSYAIDDTQYIVPSGSLQQQREHVLNTIQDAIEVASSNNTFLNVAIKHPSRKVFRFMPRQYKMLTLEWED